MSNERDPRDRGMDTENKGLSEFSSGGLALPRTDIEPLQDPEIDKIIEMLRAPVQALTTDEHSDSMKKRQEAVDKHLLRGGVDTLRKFFERIKQLDAR